MNSRLASIGSPSVSGSDTDRKSTFCTRFRCCCSNCFGAKKQAVENLGNGNNSDTGNGIKLQRRVVRNDATSTTIEQVFKIKIHAGHLMTVFYPPSSVISYCVRTVDTVICLYTWPSPAM